MTTPTDLIRIALLALLAGVALPLLVQLFLTLRSLRLATTSVEKRLDRILDDVGTLTAEMKARSASPASVTALVASAIPAVLAAVQAFRVSLHHETARSPQETATAASATHHDK